MGNPTFADLQGSRGFQSTIQQAGPANKSGIIYLVRVVDGSGCVHVIRAWMKNLTERRPWFLSHP